MRKLNTHDVFNALRIATNAKVKDQLMKAYEQLNDSNAETVGLELIAAIMSSAGECEGAIYNFLAGPLEIEADDLEKMDFLQFIETIKNYINFIDGEEWRGFFTSLLRLMKAK